MRILLTVTWFGLALWFFVDPLRSPRDAHEQGLSPGVSADAIDPHAIRTTLSDPPTAVIGGVVQKCSDCHTLFESRDVTPDKLMQHTHIVLDHGLNDRCHNCHAQQDRNKLVLRDGELVGFNESSVLCSQCHGTLYRDWERGMHGRTMGSWDASSGEMVRLRCVDCHDPHVPSFGPIELLPGPRSRGYRPPKLHPGVSEAELRNPLERWKRMRDGHARSEEESDHD